MEQYRESMEIFKMWINNWYYVKLLVTDEGKNKKIQVYVILQRYIYHSCL